MATKKQASTRWSAKRRRQYEHVKESALDARRLGFDVTVPLDGTRAVNLQPSDGEQAIPDMVTLMYKGLDPRLVGAAGRSVLAHLVDLQNQGRVVESGEHWRATA